MVLRVDYVCTSGRTHSRDRFAGLIVPGSECFVTTTLAGRMHYSNWLLPAPIAANATISSRHDTQSSMWPGGRQMTICSLTPSPAAFVDLCGVKQNATETKSRSTVSTKSTGAPLSLCYPADAAIAAGPPGCVYAEAVALHRCATGIDRLGFCRFHL